MLEASNYDVKVIRLPSFDRQAASLLTSDQCHGLLAYIAEQPDEGDILPDSGGLRKVSWPAESRTGSAGAQAIYFFHDLNMPIYILGAYGGSERLVFSSVEKLQFRTLVTMIVNQHWEDDVHHRVARVLAKG